MDTGDAACQLHNRADIGAAALTSGMPDTIEHVREHDGLLTLDFDDVSGMCCLALHER